MQKERLPDKENEKPRVKKRKRVGRKKKPESNEIKAILRNGLSAFETQGDSKVMKALKTIPQKRKRQKISRGSNLVNHTASMHEGSVEKLQVTRKVRKKKK